MDKSNLDNYFIKYSNNLKEFLPEGIQSISSSLLDRLLVSDPTPLSKATPTRYFQVQEKNHLMTLSNEEFVVWIQISPKNSLPQSQVLIALNKNGEPRLELGFVAKGIFSSPQLVIRLIESYLDEIQETEAVLQTLS